MGADGMGTDTGRDPEGPGVDLYWRRRAMALGAIIGTVGLLAWACTAGGGEGPENKQQVAQAAASESPSATPTSTRPTAMPTVTVTATPSAAKPKDGDACKRDAVVVTMTAGRKTYRDGQNPQFRVTAVNTGEHDCTFDVGPGNLDIQIESGSDRVWRWSHCADLEGSSIHLLKRGVPYVGMVTWDRKRSSKGCDGDRAKALPGTYVADIRSKQVKVKKQVFRLR